MTEQINKAKLIAWLNEQYAKHKPRNGYDEYHQGMQMMIDYTEQAVEEGLFDVSVAKKAVKCVACNGSGHYDSNGSPPCGACDGTGVEQV